MVLPWYDCIRTKWYRQKINLAGKCQRENKMNEVKTIKPEFDGDSCTYFRTSEVRPFVDSDNKINMYEGRGASRSWGNANVSSHAEKLAEDVICINVTGWHKHSVSPEGGAYYFVLEKGQWVRRTAAAKIIKSLLAEKQ